MKRPIKPFVVEVRKCQKNQKKKAPTVDLLPIGLIEEQPRENVALRRAEETLFGAGPKSDQTAVGRSGRILETIPDEEPSLEAPVLEEPAHEMKRRGRPPGSRNKVKEPEPAGTEAASAPKRRGRPPRTLEGAVRKVELTPELASAALESIAKASVVRPIVPIMSAQRAKAASRSARPTREPRAAKPDKALARQAKLEAKAAKQRAKLEAREARQEARQAKQAPRPVGRPRKVADFKRPTAHAAPENMGPQSSPALAKQHASPLDTLPRLIRMATETSQGDSAALMAAMMRPRAGERWKRRLRGAAFFAYERRHKKSSSLLR